MTRNHFKSRRLTRIGGKIKFFQEEAGVEPTALKIMAGVVLLAIGLGIGVMVFKNVGSSVTAMNVDVSLAQSSTAIGRPASGENTDTIQVDVTLIMGTAETATLDATGEPSGVTVTFAPSSGTPTFYSTMTISVDNTANPGNYTLTISAKTSDGATSGSAPLVLTIT